MLNTNLRGKFGMKNAKLNKYLLPLRCPMNSPNPTKDTLTPKLNPILSKHPSTP